MEKIKLEPNMDVYNSSMPVPIGSSRIDVLERIPYEKKVAFATEYASEVCILDEKNGYAYKNPEYYKYRLYYIAEYYTNLDVSEMDIDDVVNLLSPYQDGIWFVIKEDFAHTKSLAEDFVESTINLYNHKHGLQRKILETFGSILENGDLLQEFVQSREINEKMLDVLASAGGSADKQANITAFSEFAKRDL